MRQSIIITKVIIIFLIVSLFHCFIVKLPLAHAQSLSLAISPPIVEVLIKPGKTVVQTFTLNNRGETTTVFANFYEYGAQGFMITTPPAPVSWITFLDDIATQRPFVLKKGQVREIKVRISPPKDLPDQELYRVLLFTTAVQPAAEVSQSQLSQSIGTIFLVSVTESGLLQKAAEIVRFDVVALHDSFTPLQANIWVKNTGTTYFRPNGTITLEGLSGRLEFPLESAVVLAQATKRITVKDNTSDDSTLSLAGFFIGRYRIGTTFTLDEGSISVSSHTKHFLRYRGNFFYYCLV